MAWFSFQCKDHGKFTLSLEKREKIQKCPKCGQDSRAIIKIGSSQIVERLDNGAMARAVERLHNVEELINERAEKFAQKDPLEDPENGE